MLRHQTTPLIAVLLCSIASVSQAHSSATLLKLGDLEPSLADELPANEAFKLRLSQLFTGLKETTVKELEEKDRTESSEAAEGDELEKGTASKRLNPRVFFGSRGKRRFSENFFKRLQTGYVGSRGKRLPMPTGNEEFWNEQELRSKRFDPSGFAGSRGKRYFPGLEALVLSRIYQKLDAGKWKRQLSHFGFQASRG